MLPGHAGLLDAKFLWHLIIRAGGIRRRGCGKGHSLRPARFVHAGCSGGSTALG